MGKLYEPGRVALASQRDLATNALYQGGIVDSELAHLPGDIRHQIRRVLGYSNVVYIRAPAMIGGLGSASPGTLQVVKPPKPPWYRRRWFRFTAKEVATEGLKWAIVEGFRQLFLGRLHAPSHPTR